MLRLRRLLSKYDETRYWNSRHEPNAEVALAEARVRHDADYIREQLGPGDRRLEIGPGVGRTLEAYAPGSSVTCYDITEA